MLWLTHRGHSDESRAYALGARDMLLSHASSGLSSTQQRVHTSEFMAV